MANDGGNLQLSEAQAIDAIQNHFVGKRFIRPFLCSKKLIAKSKGNVYGCVGCACNIER